MGRNDYSGGGGGYRGGGGGGGSGGLPGWGNPRANYQVSVATLVTTSMDRIHTEIIAANLAEACRISVEGGGSSSSSSEVLVPERSPPVSCPCCRLDNACSNSFRIAYPQCAFWRSACAGGGNRFSALSDSNAGGGGGGGKNCFTCGRPGHIARDCPSQYQQDVGRPRGGEQQAQAAAAPQQVMGAPVADLRAAWRMRIAAVCETRASSAAGVLKRRLTLRGTDRESR